MVEFIQLRFLLFASSGRYWGHMAPTRRIMHANKWVVTNNSAVYLSIVVSLKETFTFDANRDITRPNLSIRSNRGNRNNFAIRITMDPDLSRLAE